MAILDLAVTKFKFEEVGVLLEVEKTMGGSDGVSVVGFELGEGRGTFMSAGSPTSLSVGV